METWLISDTHFGHENILKFKEEDGTYLRYFDSVGEMDEQLIKNWNSLVKPSDKVYHLGDVAFAKWNYIQEIFTRLNGTKVLIKGNHDNWFKLSQYAQLFKDIRASHVLDKILLAHIPIHPLSLNRWKGQVHGHLHNRIVPDDPRYYNVSVERTKYQPVNFHTIRKYYEAL